MITDEALSDLAKLCEQATPGPWFATWTGGTGYEITQDDGTAVDGRGENAEFIAAARINLPLLLAVVGQRGVEIEQLRTRAAMLMKAAAGVADDLDAFYRLRGQVVTLLSLCDGLKRFPDYEPENAFVMAREIERIFEGFDRGDVPVESAPTTEGSGS